MIPTRMYNLHRRAANGKQCRQQSKPERKKKERKKERRIQERQKQIINWSFNFQEEQMGSPTCCDLLPTGASDFICQTNSSVVYLAFFGLFLLILLLIISLNLKKFFVVEFPCFYCSVSFDDSQYGWWLVPQVLLFKFKFVLLLSIISLNKFFVWISMFLL